MKFELCVAIHDGAGEMKAGMTRMIDIDAVPPIGTQINLDDSSSFVVHELQYDLRNKEWYATGECSPAENETLDELIAYWKRLGFERTA